VQLIIGVEKTDLLLIIFDSFNAKLKAIHDWHIDIADY
jgi:hypothetical protein